MEPVEFNRAGFSRALPAFVRDLLRLLQARGFGPTLVGGSVRDFLLTGELGHDWDLELRHPTLAFNRQAWKDLARDLSVLGKMTFLPYDIVRVEIGKHQLEFSPPRRELFTPGAVGHSNFTAEHDYKLPFEAAVLRRDFTVNALGIQLGEKHHELLDPLGGLRHLRDRVLHACGPDFQRDPVRFLRALRFAQRLGFGLTPELRAILLEMPVAGLTAPYLWKEMQKSRAPLAFYRELSEWTRAKPDLRLPFRLEAVEQYEDLAKTLVDPTRHETWLVALEWLGLPSESWQKFFNLSSETGRKLARWATASRAFTGIYPEAFHGDFEAVVEREDFLRLFDWYHATRQLLQKNSELPLLRMIEEYLPAWIYLYRFEPVKDVKHIEPPLRAKYQLWNLCQRV